MTAAEGNTLLVGERSIVGASLLRHCAERETVRPLSRGVPLRVEDRDDIAGLLRDGCVQTLIYCHAVCDVGKCEAAPEWADAVNVGGLRNVLAQLSARTRVVYVSSDHVFGGDGSYRESSPPAPISAYGRSRVAAERLVLARDNALVVRSGLAIGPSLDGRTGHDDWLHYRVTRGLPITIVRDEMRSAVWAADLAERLLRLARSSLCGVRHVPATRVVSRPELAEYLLRRRGLPVRYALSERRAQPAPHLGRVAIVSEHGDALAAPLPSVLDDLSHRRHSRRMTGR
jgi:dTDP-4-dehydrorhamnose reductase